MKIENEKFKELLVNPGFITQEAFDKYLQKSRNDGVGLWELITGGGDIKDEQLGQLIAENLGIQFVNLRNEKLDNEIFYLIPEAVARSKKVIAFGREGDAVKLAMADPYDIEIRHILEKRFGQRADVFFITSDDLERALAGYKSGIKDELADILDKFSRQDAGSPEGDKVIVEIVDLLLEYGVDSKASDIHLEPRMDSVEVRFRIDGVLYEVLEIPRQFLEPILSRIKILAKMRTDEHRSAQDGKFKYQVREETVDVRVSIVPVSEGENAVMRLLAPKTSHMSFSSLGFSDTDMEKIKNSINIPQGMILVVGPTGSGKTTTIYEILKILNKPEVNIATIEDPIEYSIEGISQIQVNTKTNLTFAQGLRAIVRQDPDIIMVGEIRDEETAGIAVNSAMTGHLVLSTLHANDAATTLPRLLDMGIEPFLASSTVNIIIAQRLVRTTCEKCRYSYELKEELEIIGKIEGLKGALEKAAGKNLEKIRMYKGSGCKNCNNSGYSGRIGIFEVLLVDDKIKDLIIDKSFSDKIMEAAVSAGMTTLLHDGLVKALNGITTLVEVIRVTR